MDLLLSMYEQTDAERKNDPSMCPMSEDCNVYEMLESSYRETGSFYNRGATPAMVNFLQKSFGSNQMGLLHIEDAKSSGVSIPEGKVPWYVTYPTKEQVVLTDKNGRNPVYAHNGLKLPVEWVQEASLIMLRTRLSRSCMVKSIEHIYLFYLLLLSIAISLYLILKYCLF